MKLSHIIAATLVASTTVAPAMAGGINLGTETVTVTPYAQINRAAQYADNGEKSSVIHVDNKMSGTRGGFKVKAKVDDNFSVGGNWEIEYLSNPSSKVDIDGAEIKNEFSERKLEIWAKYNGWKISAGQGEFASDGTGEKQFKDGLNTAMHPKVQDGTGDYTTRINTMGVYSVGGKVDSFVANVDGIGRGDRIRIDTPVFNGFSLSAATGQPDKTGNLTDTQAWDVALRYAGEFGAIRVAAAASYADMDSASEESRHGGSIFLGHESGFGIGGVYEGIDFTAAGRDDHSYMYVRGSYVADDLCKYGKTSFGVEYGKAENVKSNDQEGNFWGVGAVQKLKAVSTELYVSYRAFDFDDSSLLASESIEDFTTGMAGARIKF
ncbi:MAG: porin [Alphaproteobacteria bacterium]